MKKIYSVKLVSDGVLVDFEDGTHCYYPASFLLDHVDNGMTHLFLDHDPSVPEIYMAKSQAGVASSAAQ